MTNASLTSELESLVERFGELQVEQEFRDIRSKRSPLLECTILVNQGLHNFPIEIMRGEQFIFYEGSVDLSSAESLTNFLEERLQDLADFLRSKKWRRVNIVISGHAAICMQVKLAVYRVTHIESTDWVYNGSGKYFPLWVPLRQLLSSRPGKTA